MSELRLEPLDITPIEFMRVFADKDYNLNFRVFADKDRSAFKGAKLSCDWGEIDTMMQSLREHNAQDRGVFHIVNSGGHNDESITKINAQFVEMDDAPFDDQLSLLQAFPLEPSLVVKTRKSLHSYWLIRDGDRKLFRAIQAALVKHFNGDPHCVNESRVMRIPGFYHCKQDPIMVECVHFRSDLRYTQSQLIEALPEYVPPAATELKSQPPPKGDRRGLAVLRYGCDFIRHCEQNAVVLAEHDWYAMISNLAVFEGGEALIHELSAVYPTYSATETQDKIRHFLESGTKPMNCTTIADKGFRCPKMADGSCGCKSPAAVCYRPLLPDALNELLALCETQSDPMGSAIAARHFITDYLYSSEPVTAEVFINNAIKEHFGLKNSDLRPLLAHYRDLHKKYVQSKEAKEDLGGMALPEWYTLNQNGTPTFKPGILSGYLKDNIKAFYGAEQYHIYRSGVYQASTDTEARAIVQSCLIPDYTTFNNIIDAEGQWKLRILKSLGEVNCNPYIINLRNGLYNILDGKFYEHTPEYFSTVQLACSYDPYAQCPKFERYLSEVLLPQDVPLVQEMLGYFLVPVTKAQKSFIIVGAAGSGKTQLLNTINILLLGKENVSNVEWQSLNERFKTAELYGKLANIFADLPSKNLDDNGVFKALVGEDCLTVERKNKDPFSFRPFTRLLFSCNSLPRNYGDKSEGFYRRLIIIRFPQSIPEEKKDRNLFESFMAEADGILNYALAGLRRLMQNRYVFSESENSKRELLQYRMENNSVLSFINEHCEMDADGAAEKTELYNRYKEYCRQNGFSPVSATNLNRDIVLNFQTVREKRDNIGSRRIWAGIKIVEQ